MQSTCTRNECRGKKTDSVSHGRTAHSSHDISITVSCFCCAKAVGAHHYIDSSPPFPFALLCHEHDSPLQKIICNLGHEHAIKNQDNRRCRLFAVLFSLLHRDTVTFGRDKRTCAICAWSFCSNFSNFSLLPFSPSCLFEGGREGERTAWDRAAT